MLTMVGFIHFDTILLVLLSEYRIPGSPRGEGYVRDVLLPLAQARNPRYKCERLT